MSLEDIGDMDDYTNEIVEDSGPAEGYLCKADDGDLILHTVDENGKDTEKISVRQLLRMRAAMNKLIKKINLCEDCPERYRMLTNGGGCCMMEE